MTQQLTNPILLNQNPSSNQPTKINRQTATLSAIDQSLTEINPKAKQAIYQHIETAYGIKKAEIPLRLEAFMDALEQTFGEAAKLLEIRIIQKIHQNNGFSFKSSSRNLYADEYAASLQNYLDASDHR